MLPIEAFRESLLTLAEMLRSLGIRFHITGGAAAVALGDPRTTQDVDLVVDPQQLQSQLRTFLELAVQQGFYLSEPAVRDAVSRGKLFQLLDARASVKFDVYPRELVPGELDRSVVMHVTSGVALPVVARSDAAVSKLIWIDRGSHKSRRDLREILKRATEEEHAAVGRTAAQLGLERLLNEVVQESDAKFD